MGVEKINLVELKQHSSIVATFLRTSLLSCSLNLARSHIRFNEGLGFKSA